QRRVQDRRLAVVEGQDLGQSRLTLAGDRLAPARRLRMQPRPLGARQRAVGDLLDEDVAEGVAVALGRTDEVAVDEPLAQLADARRLADFQGGDAGGPEGAAEDASELEDPSLLGRQQ